MYKPKTLQKEGTQIIAELDQLINRKKSTNY